VALGRWRRVTLCGMSGLSSGMGGLSGGGRSGSGARLMLASDTEPLGRLRMNWGPHDVARVIIAEARGRAYSPARTVAVLADAVQESGLNPRAVSPNGLWRTIFQQDASYPGVIIRMLRSRSSSTGWAKRVVQPHRTFGNRSSGCSRLQECPPPTRRTDQGGRRTSERWANTQLRRGSTSI
jgi:hypothetical protein